MLHIRKVHPLRIEASADDSALTIFRVKGYVAAAALGTLIRELALIVVIEAALSDVGALVVQSLVDHLDHVFEGLKHGCQSLLESDGRSRYLLDGH